MTVNNVFYWLSQLTLTRHAVPVSQKCMSKKQRD